LQKQTQWRAFIRKAKPEMAVDDLDVVIEDLRAFLMPVVETVRGNSLFDLLWVEGGPWSKKISNGHRS
jgi:hypothetical protein